MKKNKLVPRLRFKPTNIGHTVGKDDNGNDYPDWIEKKLGDVITFFNGKAHERYIVKDGKYIVINSKFISSNGVVKKYTNNVYLEANIEDIVMVMSDVPNGRAIAKCFYIDRDNTYTINQRICLLKSKGIKSIFLFYVLNRNKYYISFDDGVKQTNLTKNDVLSCPLVLPSKAEQTKIANFLSLIDKKIEKIGEKKRLLEEYKKGVMQKIFSQKIRFKPDHTSGKNDNGNPYPDWVEKKLGEVGKTYNGLIGKTKEDFGSGKPYIQYKQIFDNTRININNFGFVEIKKYENQKIVKFGDVFFTTSSETPTEIGYSSVLLNKVDELYLNSFCFGYRLNSFNKLNPEFIQYLFRSFTFRKVIVKLAQGSTRYNMSKIELMKINIKFPINEEQTKIANFLSLIDKKIELINKHIEQTKTYKKGLLQQMFV